MSTLSIILSLVVASTAVGQFVLNYAKARAAAESSRAIRLFEQKAVEYGIPLVGIGTCIGTLWGAMLSPAPLTRPDVLAIGLLCSSIGFQLALFMVGRVHRMLASMSRTQLAVTEELVRRLMATAPGDDARDTAA